MDFSFCLSIAKHNLYWQALAEDHRNDILSNLTAILCGGLGSISQKCWWVDPVGAILISAYIIWSWMIICMNQVF